MSKLLILIALSLTIIVSYADEGRNQGAVNNLCQNLAAACQTGDQDSCNAYKSTGCACDQSQGTCTRGNYSN